MTIKNLLLALTILFSISSCSQRELVMESLNENIDAVIFLKKDTTVASIYLLEYSLHVNLTTDDTSLTPEERLIKEKFYRNDKSFIDFYEIDWRDHLEKEHVKRAWKEMREKMKKEEEKSSIKFFQAISNLLIVFFDSGFLYFNFSIYRRLRITCEKTYESLGFNELNSKNK